MTDIIYEISGSFCLFNGVGTQIEIESKFLTIEISNSTPLPAKVYSNQGIAQFIFLKGNEAPETSYADRNGKYMGQTGVTLPKL